MTRRPRRSAAATVLALLGLAAAVLVAWSCIQLLLGDTPLIPFATLTQAGAGIAWVSSAVRIAGVVLAVIGLGLIAAAVVPGTPRVLPVAPPPTDPTDPAGLADSADSGNDDDNTAASQRSLGVRRVGIERASVAHTLRVTTRRVDGVDTATVKVTGRRVTARVRTGYTDPTRVRGEVDRAVHARLADLALARTPQLRLRVTSTKNGS